MATTAIQIDFLLSGSTLDDGTANNGGKVFFWESGGAFATNKSVYEDKGKVTEYDYVIASGSEPHTNKNYVLLDAGGKPVAEAGGRAEVYADGTYDIQIYDSSNVIVDTLLSVSYSVVPSSSRLGSYHTTGPVTIDSDTQAYYFDTSGGNISANINFDASSVSAGHNITFAIIAGTNDVTITPKIGGSIGDESTWTISGANSSGRIESDGTNDDWGIVNIATHSHIDIESGGLIMKFEEKCSQFKYKDDDEIYIGAGQYYCKDIFCWWDAQLTSDTLDNDLGGAPANSTWYYLYLDYSTISSGIEIDNTMMLWSITAPTYTEANRAWMNGDDRCIFAVYSNGSGNILEFFHDGDYVLYADRITDFAATNLSTDFSNEATLTVPSFVRKVNVAFSYVYVDGSDTMHWRTEGQTGTTGHFAGYVGDANDISRYEEEVICSSNLKIDLKDTGATVNTGQVDTNGWYLPIGI